MNILLLIEFLSLFFLAGFFSSAETAITAITKTEYAILKKSRKKNDKRISFLIKEKEKIVSSTLIMTNFLNMLISSIVTIFTLEVVGAFYIPLTTALTTIFIIVFAEIIPKTLATHFSLAIIKKNAVFLLVVYVLTYPLVMFFSYLSKFIVFCLKFMQKAEKEEMSEEELKHLIKIGKEDGAILNDEHILLKKAVHLKSVKIKSLMIKTVKIISVQEDENIQEVLRIFKMSNFSRLPVLSRDRASFLGILHYKNVLFNLNDNLSIKQIMMSPIFVPESSNVFSIIKLMNSQKRSMVFVIDEQGDVLGLLTMEDIVSLVCGRNVGEYQHKDVVLSSKNFIRYIKNKKIEVDPSISLAELNEVLGTNFSSSYYESFSGFILEKFQQVPKERDEIDIDGIVLKILKVKNAKIKKVLVSLK